MYRNPVRKGWNMGSTDRKFIEEVAENEHGIKYKYQLLSRLQMDCKYFLTHPNEKHLWAENVSEHIEAMKTLYNSFSDKEKPEWLSMNDIEKYEKEMKALVKTPENKPAVKKKMEQKGPKL